MTKGDKTMAKTVKLPYDELAKKVVDAMVVGADASTLKKVENTAKGGGGLFNNIGKAYSTKDKKYTLMVGSPFFFFMKSKSVSLCDNEEGVAYDLQTSKDWQKFYQCVQNAIAEERKK